MKKYLKIIGVATGVVAISGLVYGLYHAYKDGLYDEDDDFDDWDSEDYDEDIEDESPNTEDNMVKITID